jgi:hypothetical protein
MHPCFHNDLRPHSSTPFSHTLKNWSAGILEKHTFFAPNPERIDEGVARLAAAISGAAAARLVAVTHAATR